METKKCKAAYDKFLINKSGNRKYHNPGIYHRYVLFMVGATINSINMQEMARSEGKQPQAYPDTPTSGRKKGGKIVKYRCVGAPI